MKISLNWIKEFVDIPDKYSGKELGDLLTLKTAEVEEVIDQSVALENVVVGEILEIGPHPDADKLRICKVTDGENEYQIVCGSPQVYEGMKCALALPGAMVRWHGEGDLVEIKKAKVRGVESNGMICAGSEIGVDLGDPMKMVDLKDYDCKAGDSFAKVMGMDDVILDIDNKSLTHRPDLWNHYGLAREFAAILGQELKPYKVDVKLPDKGEEVKVEVESKEICRHSSFCIMTGIKIGESPQWMKTRLEAVGIRPINNIVDVTNYVMLECSPMHAYDRQVVSTDQIVIRRAKVGEELETIDHKKRPLTRDDVVISNGREVLLVAGVMGGAKSEINDDTTEVILEAANWNPVLVRQTSTRLGLRTDSSARFEKSLDSANCPLAVKRAAQLIMEMCPEAKISGPLVDESYEDLSEMKVKFSVADAQSKIGVAVLAKEMKAILLSLGFGVNGDGDEFEVTIPSWRATKDVDMKDDLIEEVARMFGYNNIPAEIPLLPARLPMEHRERVLKHEARRIFSQMLGFNETMNYSFYSKENLEVALLTEDGHLQIENYLSEDQTHLRISLVPNMLKAVANNTKHAAELKLYEIGRTYLEEGEYFPKEEKKICGIWAREKTKKMVEHETFYAAKSALEFFLEQFKAPKYQLKKSDLAPVYAHPSRCASLSAKKIEFARVFELHPLVAKNYKLEDWEVAVFEINFTDLTGIGQVEKSYEVLAKFPGIDIDVSVIIDRKHAVADVQKQIRGAEQKHKLNLNIKNVDLFDIYEGENIPEGKKSLAFRICLQADDRTLTSEEMNEAQQKIFVELQALGGEIRGV